MTPGQVTGPVVMISLKIIDALFPVYLVFFDMMCDRYVPCYPVSPATRRCVRVIDYQYETLGVIGNIIDVERGLTFLPSQVYFTGIRPRFGKAVLLTFNRL
jgi:hypothetical protein